MPVQYELAEFRLNPEVRVLTHKGVAVALGARAVAVLTALVSRANEYVDKAAIMDAAWPGLVVEENNLAAQISAIRRALARMPGAENWIETLARRGYRFVGPVVEITARPELRTTNRTRTNLPGRLTSFVGRERELAEVKRLLPEYRLLTLTGTGGMGKTRLAQQAATEVLDAYRDGVWFVDLAPIGDPTLVPSALARVLQVKESAGQPLVNALCSHLRTREALLILDNCEHVLDACARLAEVLLRETKQVTVIATSRESLHLATEHNYSLAALPLPDAHAKATSIARSDAVQLFVERARQYRPNFDLQEQRARAVAEICIRLDGIPLALELAAARVAVLPVEQIARLLDQRFRLLTSGNRELPRHQTLRAMIDWSYELLDDAEKALFARLSAFAGGWTLAAADAVCGGEPINKDEVVYLQIGLIEQSLVAVDEDGDRYRMLETVREYAREKLAEAGETDTIKRQHAQYFSDLFELAPDDWLRLSDTEWRAIYAPELDNVRLALDWAFDAAGEPELGIALAGASRAMWSVLGLVEEGRHWLETAAARVKPQMSESHQACLWHSLGVLLESEAPAQAVTRFDRAIDLYRRLGKALPLGDSIRRRARVLALMGHLDQSEHAFADAFPAHQSAGLPKFLAFYFSDLAFLKLRTGELVSARMYFEKALPLYRSAGAESAALAMILNLADITWALGDLDAALAGFGEAVALAKKSPFASKGMLGACLTNLAGVQTERGALEEALTAAREGLPLRNDAGHAWVTLDHLALRLALAGKFAEAARLSGFADSAYTSKETPRQPNEARAHERLRSLLRQEFDTDELTRLLKEGATLSEDEACRLALAE